MNKDNKPRLQINDKIKKFIYLIALFVFGYILQLVLLQIVDYKSYKSKGESVTKVSTVVTPKRGTIFDKNGKILAESKGVYDIYLYRVSTKEEKDSIKKIIEDKKNFKTLDRKKQLEYIKQYEFPIYKEEEIENISKILDVSLNDIKKIISSKEGGYIAKSVESSAVEKLKNLDINYIGYFSKTIRNYANNEMFSKVLGFVDDNGYSYGIEKQYANYLSGEKGYAEHFKAIGETPLPFESSKSLKAVDGLNLVTTLDEDIQRIIYDELKKIYLKEKPISASITVMNPNDGSILAMESFPTFNNNKPRSLDSETDKIVLSKMDKENISEFMQNRWNNENVSKIYEPGSVFKSITATIALESHPELANNHYTCPGYIEIAPGVQIQCVSHARFIPQTLKQAFANSCNTTFVRLIWEIGREDFVNYGSAFRFGKKTNVDLPNESSGIFPESPIINDVDFAPMSYGHSVSVTPIQILSALNATVNGGIYYQPHVLKRVEDKDKNVIFENEDNKLNKVISEETSKIMREYYENTSNSIYSFRNTKLKLGSKTGTTLKVKSTNPLRTKDINSEVNVVSIFMSYPIDNPRYTLLVVLDEALEDPTSARTAAIIGINVYEKISKLESRREGVQDKLTQVKKTPNFLNKTVEEAKILLADTNFEYEIDKEMFDLQVITQQNPPANSNVEIGTKLKLGFKPGEILVKIPSFKGMKVSDAKKILELNKINFEIKGKGEYIQSQSVAGKIININESVVLEVEEENNE